MTIAAIETRYAGHLFRSRLEARWAMFFDELGITWHYEPEAFALPNYGYIEGDEERRPRAYLPDFYLPADGVWVEVKGSDAQADWTTISDAVDFGGCLPGIEESYGTPRGLLLLGSIPRPDGRGHPPVHPLLQHHKGILRAWATFSPLGAVEIAVDDPASFGWAPDHGPLFDSNRVLLFRQLNPRVRHAYERARTHRWWNA